MSAPHEPHAAAVARRPFGTLADGRTVHAYAFASRGGVEVEVLDYGAVVRTLRVPDHAGTPADVVLGYDTIAEYERQRAFFGTLVGRYANRIAHGRFTLDGVEHRLATNDGPNHLHGGPRGYWAVLWSAAPFARAGSRGVALDYVSPDGEEGYPGTLAVRVTYTLGDDDELAVEYEARTDRATPVNLTQHSYFNLAGHDAGDVLGHELAIAASRYTPVDDTLVPTGELLPVAGTPFDFTQPHRVGARLGADHPQLRAGGGYDHNFVLDEAARSGDASAAVLHDPASGRTLEIRTTEPGIQLYGGQALGGVRGKGGREYPPHAGAALETQHFPDSPNHPHFPSTILRPGETFTSRTSFRFVAGPARR